MSAPEWTWPARLSVATSAACMLPTLAAALYGTGVFLFAALGYGVGALSDDSAYLDFFTTFFAVVAAVVGAPVLAVSGLVLHTVGLGATGACFRTGALKSAFLLGPLHVAMLLVDVAVMWFYWEMIFG